MACQRAVARLLEVNNLSLSFRRVGVIILVHIARVLEPYLDLGRVPAVSGIYLVWRAGIGAAVAHCIRRACIRAVGAT